MTKNSVVQKALGRELRVNKTVVNSAPVCALVHSNQLESTLS